MLSSRLLQQVVGAVLCFGGVAVLVHGFVNFGRKLRLVRKAKKIESKNEALGALADSGLVLPLCKVSGIIKCASPLTAGASGLQVVVCSINFKTSGGVERVAQVPFKCQIGKDELHVDTKNAEFDLEPSISGMSQKVHEAVLRVGASVFVVGKLTELNDKLTLSSGSDSLIGRLGSLLGYRPWYFISYRSEEAVVSSLAFWNNFCTCTSIVIFSAGLYLIVKDDLIMSQFKTYSISFPTPSPPPNRVLEQT